MIVFSGINLFSGGTLSIYYDCLDAVRKLRLYEKYRIVAFVHKKELFTQFADIVELIELPKSRDNYLNRLYYEYFYFKKYSKNKDIEAWISMHDMTPRVNAKAIYTYCHNALPFARVNNKKVQLSLKTRIYGYLYKFIYKFNIKHATAVIVQQNWLRDAFVKMLPVKNVIVAYPSVQPSKLHLNENFRNKENKKVFIYASYPREFKNFEVICRACDTINEDNYEVWFTIDGSENKYSMQLKNKYSNSHIKWLGLQSREKIYELYNKADCMIFPSTLETWGLPISEFKETQKPIILSDLPYAHETIGNYHSVAFFDPANAHDLASLMKEIILDDIKSFGNTDIRQPEEPFVKDWEGLFSIIFK